MGNQDQAVATVPKGGALAKRDEVLALATAGTIVDMSKLRDLFKRATEVAFVLAPSLNVSALPALHAVQINTVFIDDNPESRDVYVDKAFCKGDEVALTKASLMRILAAAGVSPVQSKPERLEPNVWRHSVVLRGRGLDGLWRDFPGTKEIDLRDGSPDAMKAEWNEQGGRSSKTGRMIPLDQSALFNARRHAPRMAEAKAINAALRGFLGLKQAYKKSELAQKPFVIPVLVPSLDMRDPDQKRAALAMLVGGGQALYPEAPQLSAGAAPGSVVDAEMVDDAPATSAATATTSGPNPPEREAGAEGPDDDDADADLPGEPAPKEEPQGPPAHLCGCRCGHQLEMTATYAAKIKAALGNEVCAVCMPGRKFDIRGHRQFPKLSFPKRLDLEPIDAAIAEAKKHGATE